jgi:sulfite reductase (NADPH) flavoprotein alpha-component
MSASTETNIYTKTNPYIAKLAENQQLNKPGSNKDVKNIIIDLGDSGIKYLPGDSLYIFPENDTNQVSELLELLDLDHDRETEFKRFSREVTITRQSSKFFKLIAEKLELDAKELQEKYQGYAVPNIIKDLNQTKNFKLSSDEVVDSLAKIQPRAYSIASSQSIHPNTVELCISRVEEEINGQKVFGLCSNYICARVGEQGDVPIYVHVNNKFRLPEDPTKDVIMVGPGTGIAPFRAFIEERSAMLKKGIETGQYWLFFGDQTSKYDYLYGEELEEYAKNEDVKISLAFSRDQDHKIYVQNRIAEHADEIFNMLENGAYFYVCGDARRMAKDVENTLKDILNERGKDADQYLKDMKAELRYCRDVY